MKLSLLRGAVYIQVNWKDAWSRVLPWRAPLPGAVTSAGRGALPQAMTGLAWHPSFPPTAPVELRRSENPSVGKRLLGLHFRLQAFQQQHGVGPLRESWIRQHPDAEVAERGSSTKALAEAHAQVDALDALVSIWMRQVVQQKSQLEDLADAQEAVNREVSHLDQTVGTDHAVEVAGRWEEAHTIARAHAADVESTEEKIHQVSNELGGWIGSLQGPREKLERRQRQVASMSSDVAGVSRRLRSGAPEHIQSVWIQLHPEALPVPPTRQAAARAGYLHDITRVFISAPPALQGPLTEPLLAAWDRAVQDGSEWDDAPLARCFQPEFFSDYAVPRSLVHGLLRTGPGTQLAIGLMERLTRRSVEAERLLFPGVLDVLIEQESRRLKSLPTPDGFQFRPDCLKALVKHRLVHDAAQADYCVSSYDLWREPVRVPSHDFATRLDQDPGSADG